VLPVSKEAERREALRRRQAERERTISRKVNLDRLGALAAEWSDIRAIERCALRLIAAEPQGLDVEALPPRVIAHLVRRNLVAVFRDRVVERGRRE